jgi:NADPH:quinone reductase-like Zn-dependent oxidoreductase/ubiquinone/menaquinone biosynthesis C-methylase UbiE
MFKDSETTCVNEVQISQPVCTALQIALVNLMSSWDIRPAAVTGHSSGEIAAAYCAGALTSKDAIAAAYHRGRISELAKQRCTAPGAMMAIGMSEEEATPALNRLESGKVVIACVNSSKSLTVSGDANAIDELEGNLKASGVFARKLAVGVAYHSHHMACVAEEYLSSISHIKALTTTRRLERCAFFSSVTGSLVSDASELGPEYWVKNLLGQVKFEASLQEMCRYAIPRATMDSKKKSGAKRLITALCEIGPHSALAGPTKQVLTAQDQLHKRGISVLSILVRNRDAVATAAGTVCQLSELGFSPSIASFNMRDPASALKYKVLSGLPPYPWNHESSYWAEPRVSKEYRLRPYCRSDILGIPVSHFHPSEPRWRNIVKVTEMPWVKDHKVQGSVVYPAAGYLCMAIEAMANQAHDQSIDVASFELKEVTIGQALVVPEDTGEVEMLLSLRPFSTSIRSPSGVWNEFCISSVSPNNRWTDHSRGLIRVNKAYKPNDVATASQLGAQKEGISEFVAKINESATSSIDPVKFYADLCDLGLDYGPTFSNVRSIRHGVDVAAASIDIADSAAVMPHGFEYPFKLHPSTLDSLFHPLFAARILQPQAAEAAFVPILLDRLVLSAKMRTGPGPQLTTWTRTRAVDNRQLSASSVIFDPAVSVDDPVVQIDGLVCMKLAETEVDGGRIKNTALGHQVSWAADVDAILPSDFEAQCQDLVSDTVEEERIEALEEAGYYLMKRALQSLSDAAIDHAQPHHKRLHNCMSLRVAEHQGRYTSDDAAVDRLLDSVSSSGAEGDLLVHVGRNLVPIIEGQRDALELMLEGGRLDAFYRDHSRFDRNYQQATRYLKLAGHKKPDMSILEIGSGTGGASLPVLKALTNDDTGIHHFGSFAFTDISTGFFEAAKAKLSQWSSVLSYEKLDIEADPLEQGFEAQSYDVILAANVLHATRSMDNTMRNVRKLLKPGGKLVVVELTRERFTTSTIFGTLPGWFAGDEEDRIRGPTLTELQWDTLLRRTGFNGVDMAASDSRFEAHHQGSMIVATASQENSVDDSNTADRRQTGDFLIIHEGGAAEIFYAEKLGSWLLNMGLMVSTSSLDSCQPEDKLCIVLSDLSRPSFDAPTDNRFRKIKAIFTASAGVLWVTSGASFDCTNPTANMATGFARTVRSEYGNNTVVTLDLDPNAKTPSEWGLSIKAIQVLISRHLLQPLESGQSESTDREYAECGGKLIIPRVTPHNSLNRSLKSLLGNAEPEMVPFEQNGQQLVVEVGTPGLLDTITFVNDTRTDAELPAGSVEISVKAAGMNFKDVMMAMGQIAYETLGGECSGIITSVGADVQNLRIGDRVACYSFGTFANRVRQDASAVQVIPDDMPMELAAALPVTFCTAYYSVIHVARIQKGQSVLIHAASGGLGQALIEICQMYGAEVFCTVGTLEKKLLLMDNYGISEERIFTSRDASFASSLMKKTGGKGVDVIMNSVAGEMLRVTWDCIAPFGIFVELGARDYTINTRLEMQKFARNVTFSAVNLVSLIRERPQIASQVWADVMDLFRRKQLKGPTPLTTYGISQLEPALRLMQSGKHLGKLVLVHQDGELVKATSSLSSSLNTLLEEDASYLLVGGMGGLGREIALWMLSQGARNFIFASRSGLAKPEAQSLKTKLEELGARVIVGKCDVSKFSELQALMDQASGLPPVKGVIQGAMVLQVSYSC